MRQLCGTATNIFQSEKEEAIVLKKSTKRAKIAQ
jgi:hypothetical protein